MIRGFVRIAGTIVGLLACLIGAVWILQGIGVLPGSFMTGQLFWAEVGLGTLVGGAVLVVLSLRPRR